jgi:uncharacterized membrane protein YkvA (DUF1232 family)
MFGWLTRLWSSAGYLWGAIAAVRHPRTPLVAKILFVLAVAYAIDPFDLIPDAIPGIGLLDDLLIVPLLFSLAWRLIPSELAQELRACRPRAAAMLRQAGLIAVGALALVAASSILLVGAALYALTHLVMHLV